DKYKVYNLCSERLYDASLFEGKVASFPFDDHNCPPIQLIISFCHSAYSWLKEDIENVVVVHCKAGMARTGLMITSLLLYLKFFPTAEESIDYYNQKRCVDGKGLVLPSQIRYVKYFERVLTYFNGEDQPGRRCMLRGIRLHRCPYWIRPSITVSDHNGVLFSTKKHPRTKDLSPEDFWFAAPRKGIMVFALPGEPGLTELSGDFKIQFHDRQGDFYCWLNTTMMENRTILTTNDLDGFDKRKLPSPGFQVEVVVVDYDPTAQPKPQTETTTKPAESTTTTPAPPPPSDTTSSLPKDAAPSEKDDEVFSDNESTETNTNSSKIENLSDKTQNISISNPGSKQTDTTNEPKQSGSNPIGEQSAMAAGQCIQGGLLEVTDGGKSPAFQEKFVFTLIEGLRDVSVSVWNSNTLTHDDYIGGGRIPLTKVFSQGFDDSSWPLQSKTGRHAGEVRLIMHYSNANNPAAQKPSKGSPFPGMYPPPPY
nr:phosphatidylinositol 3,4,5-trisphosphate 3-phosphatase and protein-tyrosine-phosphatase PTEN2A [Tanacetum cinerariifolium]